MIFLILMVIRLVPHGDPLALALTVRLGVDVLSHRGGITDGSGVGDGGECHGRRDKSLSNRIEVEEIIAVRMIQILAVLVKLRTDFLESFSMFSMLVV